jgi:predicted aspartyl protease
MNLDKICWNFGLKEDPNYPEIELYISSIDDHEYFPHFFKVDTGFSGTLGLNNEIVSAINLKARGLMTVQTAIGVKEVPYYPLKIKCDHIGLKDSLVFAIATPRAICGRTFLMNRKWLLDFKNSKFCCYKE